MKKPVDIFKQFEKDLVVLVQQTMIEQGVPKKSDLVKSVEFVSEDNGLRMYAFDYYEWLSTGRKPRARKIPIEALISWIKKYRIASGRSVNSVAWAIQQSIYRNGIKGRAFATPVENLVADFSSEEFAEILSEVIADEMVLAFEPLT
jgi:hypothetical protein